MKEFFDVEEGKVALTEKVVHNSRIQVVIRSSKFIS